MSRSGDPGLLVTQNSGGSFTTNDSKPKFSTQHYIDSSPIQFIKTKDSYKLEDFKI